MMIIRMCFLISFLMSLSAFAQSKQVIFDDFITIGTGAPEGVYYPVGTAICNMVNIERKRHRVRCSVEQTEGSVYNIDAVHQGVNDVAITQADWLFHAINGKGAFSSKPVYSDVRVLFALHPELFTLVVRDDIGVGNFEDLKGRRVNIGNIGSGQRGAAEVLLDRMNWSEASFSLASELRTDEQAAALCENKVDAIIFMAGNPSKSIKQALEGCASHLVNVDNSAVDSLVSEYPYYNKSHIDGGVYEQESKTINTFGVNAVAIVDASMKESVAYEIVRAVFENFDDFKKQHPALKNLKREDLIHNVGGAPLHVGAEKYYRDQGLID